jgi:hypothetical protein
VGLELTDWLICVGWMWVLGAGVRACMHANRHSWGQGRATYQRTNPPPPPPPPPPNPDPISPSPQQEAVDASLASRCLMLAQGLNARAQQTGGVEPPPCSPRLELALVYFFQAFRKMYSCELLGGGPGGTGGIGGPGLLSMTSVRMDSGPMMKQVGGWVVVRSVFGAFTQTEPNPAWTGACRCVSHPSVVPLSTE